MMNSRRTRIAVLISGAGSNLKALIEARQSGRLNVEIAHVISNRADAGGLQHAREAGIACSVFDIHSTGTGEPLDRAIADCLDRVAPDLIVLAGYMRILGPDLVRQFRGKMINLHPSLLPRHPGLDTYRKALAAGDGEHGSSMHFVTAGLDDGPLVAQARIAVLPGDTPGSLAVRLGPVEHRLIVATVELFTRHVVEQGPEYAMVDGMPLMQPLLLQDDDTLA
jgi:phosphoribosylglycinamide formyltransferase-1